MKANRHKFYTQILLAIFFGLLSFSFSFFQFEVADLEGLRINLMEVPLLISVLYLSNLPYAIVAALIGASLSSPEEGSFIADVASHIAGITFFWIYYHLVLQKAGEVIITGVMSLLGCFIYYFVVVIPIICVLYSLDFPEISAYDLYLRIIGSAYFEVLATTLIFIFFLIQYRLTIQLKDHINNMEQQVVARTSELNSMVDKLNAANEELRTMNENLDKLVAERTRDLESRNVQLSGYAFINSHILRAPIARILGLSALIRSNNYDEQDPELVDRLIRSCQELDRTVQLMSEFLNDKVAIDSKQMNLLQKKIREISEEIQLLN